MDNKLNHQEVLPPGFFSWQQYRFPTIINACVWRGSCPCACVHCPVGRAPVVERATRFGTNSMSLDLWEKIVGETVPFKQATLRIHGVGEPLLWPQLVPALKYASEKGVRTWLFTSLITENPELVENLARYCNIIEVSINSVDVQDYLLTKGVNAFACVSRNLERLAFQKKNNSNLPRLLVSRVESQEEERDQEFVAYWQGRGWVDDAFIRSYHDYNSLLARRGGGRTRTVKPCLVHWSRFNVDCDGSAVLCFNELFKGPRAPRHSQIGDVWRDSIQTIWQGPVLTSLRQAQWTGDYSLLPEAETLPCLDCTSCQSLFDRNKPTSESQVGLLGTQTC